MSSKSKKSYTQVIVILSLFILYSIPNKAQSTLSPYSMYGLGKINTNSDSRSFGMGGSGIALRSTSNVSTSNAASLSALDSTNFYINFNIKADITKYQSKESSANDLNANFDNVAFGFKAAKWWGVGFGLKAFSSVGYHLSNTQYIVGTNIPYTVASEGAGGLNMLYFSNGFNLTKNWSIGLQSSLLWGQISSSETSIYTILGGNSINNTEEYYLNKFIFEPGIQYNGSINQSTFSVGATFRPETTLNTTLNQTIGSSSEENKTSSFTLPQKIGIGVTYSMQNMLLFSADYRTEKWSSIEERTNGAYLNDAGFYNFGVEFSPQKNQYKNLFNRMKYRAGAFYNDTYLKLNNFDLIVRGFSFGIEVPIGQQGNSLNLGYQYQQFGSDKGDLFKETLNSIKLGISLKETWFMKSKFY